MLFVLAEPDDERWVRVANFKMVPIATHFDVWSPLLESVKDLPDGTRISFKVVP